MALSFIIGIIGNVISILVFASPIKTFARVVKKRATENYKGVPYITTLLSTSLWSFYGLLKPGGLLVVTVNGAGAVLQFTYVTLFLIYAPRDKKVKLLKLVGVLNVGFLGAVITVTLLALHGSLRLTFVGILCCGLTIGMYAAPLAVMRTVIKTRSVEYMPFLLSFFLFLNAGAWSTYAVLVKDIFLGIPNAVGLLLGSVQLILYSIYKNKSPLVRSLDDTREKKEDVGSSHLFKGDIEMRAFEEDGDESNPKNHCLCRGLSLPKSSIQREYSLAKIVKTFSLSTLSMGPYELHSSQIQDDDHVEDGNNNHHSIFF